MCWQFLKQFTCVSYDCSKISWHVLKKCHGRIHSENGIAYFVRLISYKKVFLELTIEIFP